MVIYGPLPVPRALLVPWTLAAVRARRARILAGRTHAGAWLDLMHGMPEPNWPCVVPKPSTTA
jgi:hypothetical protein